MSSWTVCSGVVRLLLEVDLGLLRSVERDRLGRCELLDDGSDDAVELD